MVHILSKYNIHILIYIYISTSTSRFIYRYIYIYMSITVVCPYGFLGSRHDDFACQSRTLLQLAVYQYVSGMLPSQAVHDVWAWHDVSCKMNTLVLFFRGKLTLSRSSTDVMGPGSFEMFGMLPFSVLKSFFTEASWLYALESNLANLCAPSVSSKSGFVVLCSN